MSDSHKLGTIEAARTFLLAGNATATLVNEESGKRVTYKVQRAKGEDAGRPWFVKAMTGPDNEVSYTYLGTLFADADGLRYFHGKKSPINADAPSARGAAWLFGRISVGAALPATVSLYHEGRCGACGRKLTVPESIETGLGPDCAERLGAIFAPAA